MAAQCPNCGKTLIYDPGLKKMLCEYCGSTFRTEEVDAPEKKYAQDTEVLSAEDVFGTKSKDFLDCNIYTCSNCGGEVIVNNTESSTYCIYCGNPTIVFSRIARQKRPEFILPFSISREQAVEVIHNKVSKGIFIPNSIKHFNPDYVRGIYIPYWIVNVDHKDALFIKGSVKRGKNTVTKYYQRAGSVKFKNLPLDASRKLNDESTFRLEPFDLTEMKTFDEDYLSGFYSDIGDVTRTDINRAASVRASQMFNDKALSSVKASDKKILSSSPVTTVGDDPIYAMLPAWFITLEYKGNPMTVLVNGSTGKVVCALPWRQGLFAFLLITFGLLLSAAAIFLLYWYIHFELNSRSSHSSDKNSGKLFALIIGASVFTITEGIRRMKNVIHNLKLTRSKDTLNYVRKRQG